MPTNNNTIYFVGSRDYLYSGNVRLDKPEKNYSNQRIAYDQKDVGTIGNNSCSIHATITNISNLTGRYFSKKERLKICEDAADNGYDPSWGWTMHEAVNFVVKWCNKNLNMDLEYIRVNWKDYETLARMGFSITTGWQNKIGMGVDRSSDGIIGNEGIEYKDTIYGHLFNIGFFVRRSNQRQEFTGKLKNEAPHIGMIDNYFPKHAHNETYIHGLEKLVKDGVIFPNGYIIVEREKRTVSLGEAFKRARQKLIDFRRLGINIR